MNDEIKELIRDCNELLNNEFFTLNNIEITRHELNLLLDYITNLQQELEEEKRINEEDLKLIDELQQENERLKLELSGYREAILRDDKLLGLQQRIEKAVDYIRQYDGHIEGYYYSKEHKRFLVEENVKDDLLNILDGEE